MANDGNSLWILSLHSKTLLQFLTFFTQVMANLITVLRQTAYMCYLLGSGFPGDFSII